MIQPNVQKTLEIKNIFLALQLFSAQSNLSLTKLKSHAHGRKQVLGG
jgi:hypothetical protein